MSEYHWVTHFTKEGYKYGVLEKARYELRIPPHQINSTMYVYSSLEEAEKGVPAGGSGFFVGISAGIKDAWYVYAVTNVHVIAECSEKPVIRVNKKGGGFIFIELPKEGWVYHPAGDDIAVCQVRGITNSLEIDLGVITPNEFVTEQNLQIDNLHIGPGDNTYMIGRFTNHEGSTANTPIVRYGNISLNPDKNHLVWNSATQHDDEVFLIEARSVSGYSGSPTFMYIPGFDDRGKGDRTPEITPEDILSPVPYFLGVNIGHTRMRKPVQVKKPHKPTDYIDLEFKETGKLYSEYNSGIMRIAPAWKLQEMLDMEVFADVRKKQKQQQETEKQKSFTLDSLPEEVRKSVNISKDDFEKSLKKASRKTKPSSPDQQ